MEKTLPDRSRIDCLSGSYAIEVEFARKWAEGAGQALYYAQMTGRAPAVALIVGTEAADLRDLKRLRRLAKLYGIRIMKISKEGE